ncbi:hypothetical protein CVT25_001362 [Psilocybe cyanescens]|uniref:Uncharacterized protein n=1 Tax=Psilocybe cyanescens TaxID=93625 RepID=A0A409XER5_PSICY|nr:hypothetical protein CVT25_001362 [Psilocybe cyanescens]
MEGHRGLLRSLDVELVEKWEKMCTDWESNLFPKKAKNPYHLPDNSLTEAQVKKELSDEEAEFFGRGGGFSSCNDGIEVHILGT